MQAVSLLLVIILSASAVVHGKYIFVSNRMNWQDANDYCAATYGTSLATITTGAEIAMAREIISQNGQVWAYIGLSKLSGSWQWASGQTCDYDGITDCEDDPRWRTTATDSEPNGSGNNNCAYVNVAHDYNDMSCDSVAPSLCDIPVALTWRGWNPGSGLAECTGDCDSDNDCSGTLECYHDGVPPGCDGAANYQLADYCYEPLESSAKATKQEMFPEPVDGRASHVSVVTLSAKDLTILVLLVVNVVFVVALCCLCARSRTRGTRKKYQAVQMVADSESEEVRLQ